MSNSNNELQYIAELAYIELNQSHISQLTQDVHAILEFVAQLKEVSTEHIAPLLHPLDQPQPLRDDSVNEPNHINELAQCAPEFADGFYLVPKVIEERK